MATATDGVGDLRSDVVPAGFPQVASTAVSDIHVGQRKVYDHVGRRLSLAQRPGEPGQVLHQVRHRWPRWVAVVECTSGVEIPAHPRHLGRGVRPPVPDQLVAAEEEMLMRLALEVHRSGAERWRM